MLGLNGAAGSQSALKTLQSTPGYQFQLQQGDNAINAQAAATGQNASGNQALALSKFNQGLAGTTYQNYVNSLLPFLGASNAAASGGANVQTGLGNQLAGQYGNLANLGWQTKTGIGNANANADLAGLNASGNFWNALGSLGSMGTAGGGTLGGNLISGLGSLAGSIFSDKRLKEDIAPVGKLYDGQEIYKYRYIGSPVWQIGVMAQDVENVVPEAVRDVGGFKAVNLNEATKYAADLAKFLKAA